MGNKEIFKAIIQVRKPNTLLTAPQKYLQMQHHYGMKNRTYTGLPEEDGVYYCAVECDPDSFNGFKILSFKSIKGKELLEHLKEIRE